MYACYRLISSVVVQFYPWFKFYFLFKFKPKIKLNHNTPKADISDTVRRPGGYSTEFYTGGGELRQEVQPPTKKGTVFDQKDTPFA